MENICTWFPNLTPIASRKIRSHSKNSKAIQIPVEEES